MSGVRTAKATLVMASTNVWHALNAWPEEPASTTSCQSKMEKIIEGIDELISKAEAMLLAEDKDGEA